MSVKVFYFAGRIERVKCTLRIMVIFLPSTFLLISLGVRPISDSPVTLTSPLVGLGEDKKTHASVYQSRFPHPDSPATPRISPLYGKKLRTQPVSYLQSG